MWKGMGRQHCGKALAAGAVDLCKSSARVMSQLSAQIPGLADAPGCAFRPSCKERGELVLAAAIKRRGSGENCRKESVQNHGEDSVHKSLLQEGRERSGRAWTRTDPLHCLRGHMLCSVEGLCRVKMPKHALKRPKRLSPGEAPVSATFPTRVFQSFLRFFINFF